MQHVFSKKILLLVGLAAIVASVVFVAPWKTMASFEEEFTACVAKEREDEYKGECLRKLARHTNTTYTIPDIDMSISKINDSQALQWCHEFMHYAGWEIYKQTQNMFDAFSLASNKCDSGMYHGVTEEYINEVGGDYGSEFVSNVIPNACESGNKNLPPGLQSYCYHGLGHAFMFVTENDLNKSLEYCDYLPHSEVSCYSGSLMENIQSKQVGASGHASKFRFDSANEDFPCDVLAEKYKSHCYVYKGVSNVVRTKGDFQKSFEDCLKVKQAHQTDCLWGVGSNIPGPHWTSADAGRKCAVALEVQDKTRDLYALCVRSAMSFLVSLNVGDANAPVEFCNEIQAEHKNICYRAAGRNLKDWVTPQEDLAKKCSLFKDPLAQKECENPEEN